MIEEDSDRQSQAAAEHEEQLVMEEKIESTNDGRTFAVLQVSYFSNMEQI